MRENFLFERREFTIDGGNTLANLAETCAEGGESRLNFQHWWIGPGRGGEAVELVAERPDLGLVLGNIASECPSCVLVGLDTAVCTRDLSLEVRRIETGEKRRTAPIVRARSKSSRRVAAR